MEQCNQVPLLGYHVETLADGSKICITKPGGKSFVDFQVWVVTPHGEAWRPSHAEIGDDLRAKCQSDAHGGKEVVRALRKVFEGQDPEEVTRALSPTVAKLPGFAPDLILKVYKWIFAQEDCNHPPPRFEGREMAMKDHEKLLTEF
jgi:hypothetical protein